MNQNLPNRRSFLQRSLAFVAAFTATPLLGRANAAPSPMNRDVSTVSDALSPLVSSEPFIGEIMLVSFDFAPRGWALCNGQLMSIAQNTALFSLLGTTFGGDGRTTFGLPDLRGRMAVGQGSIGGLTIQVGQQDGSPTTTLSTTNIPAAVLSLNKAQIRTTGTQGSGLADGGNVGTVGSIVNNGSSVPVNNMPPCLVMNYVIALYGIFPSRS